MAKIEFDYMEDLISEFEELNSETPKIMKEMVEAGGKAALNAVKLNTPVRNGDLRRSVHTTGGHNDKYGNWYDNVHFGSKDFEGYDRKGVPNDLKANVLDVGRDDYVKIKATHFLSKAMKNSKDAANAEMQKVFEKRTGMKNDN